MLALAALLSPAVVHSASRQRPTPKLATGKRVAREAGRDKVCEPIHEILDAHAAGPQASPRRRLVHIERPSKPGGVGDQ